MFGYAINETKDYMPLALDLSNKILQELAILRKENKDIKYLRPDSKSQVTIEYSDNNDPVAIKTIVISTQHDDFDSEEVMLERIKKDIKDILIPRFLRNNPDFKYLFSDKIKFLVNPTGKFVIGGPQGDAGLTGRKIIVDTYGGYSRHGGGAFSGKDPTKVDRSAAYACRYVAKNIVAAGLAKKCEVQVSYAIGVARPVSIFIDTFGTSKVDEIKLLEIIKELFELRPAGIIQNFRLRQLPAERNGRFYQDTAVYGHFGRDDLDLPWESTDKAMVLNQAFSINV